jgi:signal transduction histidine kinase/ActR/RegA family two-component response regulator
MALSGSQRPWFKQEAAKWPRDIAEYIQEHVLAKRSPAFLLTDSNSRVLSIGGDLVRYGLADLRQGDTAPQKAYFLEGLLPLDTPNSILCNVETASGVFADIHMFQSEEGDRILLLNSSDEVAEREKIERALRQLEEQLRQAEKMEALGRLVGGVAHDFNNLLTIILGYSHFLIDSSVEEKYRVAAVEIKGAAEKAAQMTRHLLTFSRHHARRVEVVDLNALISRLQPLLRRLIGEDIAVAADLDPSLVCVEADPGQLEQVLMNLAANARDAMPGGGVLSIHTSNVDIGEEYLTSHPSTPLKPGPHIELVVQDDGCGMDEETLARVFEPFFTSKESGHGTGLGLAIVYGIVCQSYGEISLTSRLGSGTCVRILLPAVRKQVPIAKDIAEERPTRGNETILVVEDDESFRHLVREILIGLGYKVLESPKPEEALTLCERHRGRVDLLITDFVMPRMNGRELASRIVAVHPETSVLYMSGYGKESTATRSLGLRDGVFLSKPFSPGLLADRVREALACGAT